MSSHAVSGAKRPVWTWTDAVAAAEIAPLTKLVCLNIGRYFSSAGKGWRVPVKQMMADTGLSNRSIATHLQLATDAKLLIIKREIGAHGQRGVTTYVPCFPDGVELAREAELPPSEAGSLGPSEPGSRGQSEPASLRPREGGSRQVSSLVSPSQETKKPSKTVFADGAGDRLIPFEGTDAGTIVADAKAAHAAGARPLMHRRLPFTADVIARIRRMCVDVEALAQRYKAKTRGRRISDPSAYLFRMAQEEVAKRDGIAVETVIAMASTDRTKCTEAMAKTLDGETLEDLKKRLAATPRKTGDQVWQEQRSAARAGKLTQ